MQKRHHDDPLRPRTVLALCCLALALLIPSAAVAQDPAGDQYAPATPTGGNQNGSPPVQTSGSGHDPVTDTSSGDTSSAPTGTSSATTSSAPTPADTASTTSGDDGNKAQRTVHQLAAAADQQRQQRAEANGTAGGDQTTESLSSSSQSSGSGMGTFLLVALGLTLLWAVAAGIVNFRRRSSAASESKTANDTRRREPAREDGHPA